MRSTSAFCCDMAGADRTTWWGYALPLRQCSAGDIQTIEETRVASFRKLLVAGTAIADGLGWASQSVVAEPGGELVEITGATVFDATGTETYRGNVRGADGRYQAVGVSRQV